MACSRWISVGWGGLLIAAFGACNSSGESAATSASSTAAGGASAGAGGTGGAFMCSDAGVDANAMGPTVQIIAPTDGQVFQTTDIVPLEGSAMDPVDGAITSPTQLFWYRDSGDPTGEGLQDAIDPSKDPPFSVGTHPITFKAVDSRCLEASATVNIVVQ